jgi:hypothetical protein
MVTAVILSAVASLHKASVVRIDPDDKLKQLGRFLQQKMSMSNIVEVTIEKVNKNFLLTSVFCLPFHRLRGLRLDLKKQIGPMQPVQPMQPFGQSCPA